ncbi:MAG: DinB family protein [Acidobacteriota bacterium]|nr:DinB family protein [Acidobacteriota bacterium]
MSNDDLTILRKQLVSALGGGESHIIFEAAVKDFPPEHRGAKPAGAPHSAWELIEHMRIAQRDIIDFVRDPRHKSPHFPEGYWPKTSTPADEAAWAKTVQGFESDRKELAQLIEKDDLFTALPHGDGQTLLREALLVANHNSYELGQVVFLKRMLNGKKS